MKGIELNFEWDNREGTKCPVTFDAASNVSGDGEIMKWGRHLGHFARKKWMENRWRGGGQVKTGADGSIQAVIMETIVKVLAKNNKALGGNKLEIDG